MRLKSKDLKRKSVLLRKIFDFFAKICSKKTFFGIFLVIWRKNVKIISEMDLGHTIHINNMCYVYIFVIVYDILLFHLSVAAILDLCKLRELPKVAKLATKLNFLQMSM